MQDVRPWFHWPRKEFEEGTAKTGNDEVDISRLHTVQRGSEGTRGGEHDKTTLPKMVLLLQEAILMREEVEQKEMGRGSRRILNLRRFKKTKAGWGFLEISRHPFPNYASKPSNQRWQGVLHILY